MLRTYSNLQLLSWTLLAGAAIALGVHCSGSGGGVDPELTEDAQKLGPDASRAGSESNSDAGATDAAPPPDMRPPGNPAWTRTWSTSPGG
jgi:hypothetical protein